MNLLNSLVFKFMSGNISTKWSKAQLLSSYFLNSTYVRKMQAAHKSSTVPDSETNVDLEHAKYQELVNRYFYVPDMGHQVLVVQPYIKWGPGKTRNTTPDLQLDEAVSLIRTLKQWKVVDKLLVPVERSDKKLMIGSGNLEKLQGIVQKNKKITAVFMSVSMLKGFQRSEFEHMFKVQVFDRYSIVIQIFKEHAKTSEAKLQVALAEVPYLRSVLNESSLKGAFGGQASFRGSGENPIEVGKRVLETVEMKLKAKLKKVQEQRQLSRKKREKLKFPVVAVVGYTNSGKTSLIKALTGETQMQPSDELFATLDVTSHLGILPCRLKVLYVDTVGFMSELPTTLMECFLATLEDVMNADVILHVCDVSNPDVTAQAEHVLKTLKTLQVPESLVNKIITVENKCDKMNLFKLSSENSEPIKTSAVKLSGISVLENKIQDILLTTTDRQSMVIRVSSGGHESRWLYKEAAVTEVWPDPDNPQYIMMSVVISKVQLAKFKKQFIS